MRLRHKLIPYIYTMMHRNTKEGIPMVRPMYHAHSTTQNAFSCKNEYYFGDLIAAPITTPADRESRLAKVKVWLPRGTYVDFFTGRIYAGDRFIHCYRAMDVFPLFAKVGTILPLNADGVSNDVANPKVLELHVFGGADGSFTMVEDNGKIGKDNIETHTKYSFTYGEAATLTIESPEDSADVPEVRAYVLHFSAFTAPDRVTVTRGGREEALGCTYDAKQHTIVCDAFTVAAGETVSVTVYGDGKLPENEIESAAFNILIHAQTSTAASDMLTNLVNKKQDRAVLISDILTRDIHKDIAGALVELLSAK